MMPNRASTGIALIAVCICCLSISSQASGITIRDDLTEADYINRATDPKWGAAGVFTSTSTCFASGGTLIHPEFVITAGHCQNATAEFILGADRSAPDIQVPVIDTERHPNFSSNVGNGKDLGVSQLGQPILDVTPLRIYRGNQEIGKTVTVLGYGRFGTGDTGDNQSGVGIRRAGDNRIDLFGNSIGQNVGVMITDFDDPNNPADSFSGPAAPVPFESGIAFYDSGSGWLFDVNGSTYVAGVTSFRTNTTADGNPNSDYGDIFGGTRLSTELTWLDGAHDQTKFWDKSFGNWSQDTRWDSGSQPAAQNAAVIDGGIATISAAGETAEYTFVVQTGELQLQNNFASDYLLLREGGRLHVNNATSATTLTGILRQESDGTLEVNVRAGDTVGSGYDRLVVTGDAEIAGTLEINGASNSDPQPGEIDQLVVLTASNLIGQFDDVVYDGEALIEGVNKYVGVNNNGNDGMFRKYEYSGNTIVVENYSAIPGDANGDGLVDGNDFLVWNASKFTVGGDWTTGDFNGDNTVDGNDFLIWNSNKFTSVDTSVLLDTTVAVPEPTTFILLLIAGGLLSSWRSN